MGLKLSISVTMKPTDFARRLGKIPSAVLMPEFRKAVFKAENYARMSVTDGNPLHVRTGRLRSSITSDAQIQPDGSEFTGRVGSNVKYAAIHEMGGVIPAHRVVPRKAHALRFIVAGQVVFARYADIPAITMPARPYLMPAAQKAMDEFVKRIEQIDLVEAVNVRS